MQPNRSLQCCLAAFVLLIAVSSCHSTSDSVKPAKTDSLNEPHPLTGAGIGIINTSILVKNLDSAIKYYNDTLGFKLKPVDTAAIPMYEGTASSSLTFPEGASLELLGIKDSGIVAKKNAFIPSFLQQYQGVRLYTLSTSSADTTKSWLQSQGFKTDTIASGRLNKKPVKGWESDNGGAQWRSVSFNRQSPPAILPDFVEWPSEPLYEYQPVWRPYAWRKYYDSLHNGAVEMSYLKIVVKDLDSAKKEFSKMGLQETESNDSVVKFKIAYEHSLYLVQPQSKQTEEAKFLQSRGEGVFGIGFIVNSSKDSYAFFKKKLNSKALVYDSAAKKLSVLQAYALGVQLDFIQESKENAALAAIYGYKDDKKLDSVSATYASALYTKYCSLCHGDNREGYAADHAPSLRSKELFAVTQSPRSAYNFLMHTIEYGRTGTAMAPYAKNQGGPLNSDQIELLIKWLYDESGVKKNIELPTTPVIGNIAQGKIIYDKHCTTCHGKNGEGIVAPALANPMFLATASDAFLQYTITNGRDSTRMPSFKDSLKKKEIAAVTAFLRSRATGWNAPEAVTVKEPDPKEYVLNPTHKAPVFALKSGKYVAAEQVLKALKDSAKLIILDARSKAAWNQTHIPGAVPVPYYDEPDTFIKNIPNDDTWVLVYCACPHAASDRVVNTLRRFKYKNTAILDEGILVWAQRGYPVQYGQDGKMKK